MAEKPQGKGKQPDISELELQELVTECHSKARETGHWADYLTAHGGANYLAALKPTEKRLEQVYEIENSWYGGKHPLSPEEQLLLTNKHRGLLEDLRDDTRIDFDSLRIEREALSSDDIFSDATLNRVLNFSRQIFAMSRKCTERFIAFNQLIIQSCVNVLGKDGHFPPCSFAVIGLGSVARGEATPYSDLEYAFIVENNSDADYFQKLAVESYFRIDNLGETPLKTIGIKRTVRTASNDPPVGYRIDGISRRAGHIPTGHPDSDQSLILTVDQLMDLYKKEVMLPPDGERPHDLADLLSTSVLIYSHKKGEELHMRFLNQRLHYEENFVRENHFATKKRLSMLSRDLSEYNFLPNFKFSFTKKDDVKVKADIFRYPTLIATDLNISLALNSHYSWDTYTKLHELGLLTEEDLVCMHIVLALSIYIRATAYLAIGGQSEQLSLHTAAKVADSVTERYHVPQNIFLILGCLLIPIKKAFLLALQRAKGHQFKTTSSDSIIKFQSVMKGFKISKTDFMLKAEILSFAEDHQRALEHLYRAVGKSKVNNCVEFIKVIRDEYRTDKSDPAEKNYLDICQSILYHADDYNTAIDYLTWLITYEKHPVNIALRKLMVAMCMNRLEKHKPAKSAINQVLLQIKEWLGLDGQESLPEHIKQILTSERKLPAPLMSCINITSHVYETLGKIFDGLEQRAPALECYKDSVKIKELMKGNGEFIAKWESYICHGGIIRDLSAGYSNIGTVYEFMGDYKQSLVHQMRALKMREVMYGKQTNHFNIASSCNNIGILYNKMGYRKQSIFYHMKALETIKTAYGEQPNRQSNIRIAISCSNIANVYYDMGDYSQSLMYYMKDLEMKKTLYGEHANRLDIADSYKLVGTVYGDLGLYTQSLTFYMKALEMRKAVHGKHTNHIAIANSYCNIGITYSEIGDYKQSLVYHTKVLNTLKAVYASHNSGSIQSPIANAFTHIGNLYQSTHQNKVAISFYSQALMTPNTDNLQKTRILTSIAKVWVDHKDYHRAQQFLYLSIKQTPTSSKLLQAENFWLMGICHLNARSWSRSWKWLYSALCLYEQAGKDVCSTTAMAKLHNTVAMLLLYLGRSTVALEHSQKSLDITNKLLEKFSRHAECIRVNKEAKSLTDSLHLMKLVQHEFPNRI